MPGDIDPRLLEEIAQAGDTGEVEAVILVESRGGVTPPLLEDARGPGGALLDRVTQQIHDAPSSVQFMPRLGALVVKGSSRLVRRLIADPAVIAATVNAADISRGGVTPPLLAARSK